MHAGRYPKVMYKKLKRYRYIRDIATNINKIRDEEGCGEEQNKRNTSLATIMGS